MGKKDDLLREIEEARRRELERKRETRPYRPSDMDCSRMPFGCWIWLLLAFASAAYAAHKWL